MWHKKVRWVVASTNNAFA